MLTQQQQLAVNIVGVALLAQAGVISHLLKRSFTLENKAVALGQVMYEHLDVLTDEDRRHLLTQNINFNK